MSDPTPRGKASKSKWDDPVIRERIIAAQRAYWNNSDGTPNLQIRKDRGKIAKAALASPEVRHNISEGTKEGLKPAEVRQKISTASTKAWDGNTKRREQASETARRVFGDPAVQNKRLEGFNRPETLQKIREGGIRSHAEHPERGEQAGRVKTDWWIKQKAKLAEAERILAERHIPDWESMRDDYKIACAYLLVAPDTVSNRELAKVMGRDMNRSFEQFANRVRNRTGKPGGRANS